MISAFKNIVKEMLERQGYAISKKGRYANSHDVFEFSYDGFLTAWLSKLNLENAFFVQIGANDGQTQDPLFDIVQRKSIKGCLVEPQPDVFKRLQKNYKSHLQIILENSAISTKSGQQDFYAVREDKLPEAAKIYNLSKLNSFNRDFLLECLGNYAKQAGLLEPYESYIKKEKVSCITFSDLLAKHKIDHIDLLLIDTESYDYEILKMIDFKKCRPDVIFYEYRHLEEQEKQEAWDLLNKEGYLCFVQGMNNNTLAIRGNHHG